MENFIVSARKYRPLTFKSVVGQENITSTLQNSIRNNHLAQAFLFCGPRGVGKTTCARILAKTINCFALNAETEPCNECESCRSFNENASFNIHELDAASNNSVDDIRLLIDQVRFAPQVGKYSVYIIDEVHMLSTSAFNAFLKTLEEPPAHAIFILATTERHKILPTILSRCQVFTFNRIRVDDIAGHLEYVAQCEKIEADPDALHVIAQKADGGLRDALSMFDQIVSFSGGTSITYEAVIDNLNVLDYDYYFRLTDFLLQGNYSASLLLFDEVLSKGFDGGNFLSGLAEHFRNLLVCQDAATLPLLEVSVGVKSRYQSQSQQCQPIMLVRALELVNKTEQSLRTGKNQRLNIELGLLQLVMLIAPPVATAPVQVSSAPGTESKPAETQPVPASEKKPVVNFRGASPVRTISIRQHLKKPTDDQGVENTESDHSIREALPAEIVAQSALTETWKQYANRLKTSGRTAMWGTLTLSDPKLNEDLQITYEVQNDSQLREVEMEKPDLLLFLRKELNNYQLSLKLLKADAPPSNKPFTIEEKIKALEEKNPNVALLRKKLGLEPE
jgi:DNA polymerase III subunit gamma/tau